MAGGTNISMHPNHTHNRFFTSLDPKSLISSQFSHPHKTKTLIMERGPRYKAYSDLRESKLRMRSLKHSPPQHYFLNLTPHEQIKLQGNFHRKTESSVLTQSVPDFSAVLRKENRKPMLPPMTPPSKSSKGYGSGRKLGGSKSVKLGEKRNGGLMGRNSNACVEELKGLCLAASNAINEENRGGGRTGRGGVGKSVLGYRQN